MKNSVEISKKKVVSGFVWKFSERITAQLISLVVSTILARMLSPDDYGVVAMVMVFITIANVFVSNGLGNALIQKKDADNLDFSTVFYVNILMGIVIYIVLFFTAPYIASFYQMDVLCLIIRVLGIRIVVAAVNSVQQAYVSRNMLFKRFFWSTLFGTLVSGVVGIIMAYMGCGVWALVTQYLVNTCTDTIVLWFTVKWRPELRCSIKRAKDLFSFGWKILISSLIDTGYNQLRSLIIGKKYTSVDLAFYNQGDKYPAFLVVNIDAAITSVLFPLLSQNQDDKKSVKNLTRLSMRVSSYIIWPIMVGFAAVAEPFVRVILTDKWIDAVPFLRVFCITYALWPVHTANLQAINALGRSDLFLKLEIIKKVVGIAIIIITMPFGPFAMAIGMLVGGIISTFINAFPNKFLLQYTYIEQVKDILPSILMSFAMWACISFVSYFEFTDITTLLIQVLLGISIYVMESYFFKNDVFMYLLGHIKKALK